MQAAAIRWYRQNVFFEVSKEKASEEAQLYRNAFSKPTASGLVMC